LSSVNWPVSNGEVSARHQPELFAASEVRNEVITVPAVGIAHSRQTTVTVIRTGQPARAGRRPRCIRPSGAAGTPAS
jgi:hypothetical protein